MAWLSMVLPGAPTAYQEHLAPMVSDARAGTPRPPAPPNEWRRRQQARLRATLRRALARIPVPAPPVLRMPALPALPALRLPAARKAWPKAWHKAWHKAGAIGAVRSWVQRSKRKDPDKPV